MNKLNQLFSLLSACSLMLFPTGCTGLASVARQLKNDPAFVTVEVKTLYGSGILVRDGRPNSANTVTDSGAVTSTPGTNSNAVAPQPPQPAQQSISREQFAALVNARAAELAKGQTTNAPAK